MQLNVPSLGIDKSTSLGAALSLGKPTVKESPTTRPRFPTSQPWLCAGLDFMIGAVVRERGE